MSAGELVSNLWSPGVTYQDLFTHTSFAAPTLFLFAEQPRNGGCYEVKSPIKRKERLICVSRKSYHTDTALFARP